MARLKYLVIHCTATPEGRHVDKQEIISWHTNPKVVGGRGWRVPGYSDLVLLDGTLELIVDWNNDNYVDNWEITNGAKGINGVSRHVCYVGGVSNNKPKDTRTEEQKKTLETYVKFMLLRNPNIKIAGHYKFAVKSCPNFNVEKWLEDIGIDEKNIL